MDLILFLFERKTSKVGIFLESLPINLFLVLDSRKKFFVSLFGSITFDLDFSFDLLTLNVKRAPKARDDSDPDHSI